MGNDLRAPCKHGRYERHPLPDAEPTVWLGLAGMAYADEDWCPGGRKIEGETIWWCEPWYDNRATMPCSTLEPGTPGHEKCGLRLLLGVSDGE